MLMLSFVHHLPAMPPKQSLLLTFSLLLTSLDTSYSTCKLPRDINGQRPNNVEGLFVFGSSIVDNGNNNLLRTLVKADYSPYGMDFPLGPSGRFTNGKTVVDLLGEYLEIPSFIPPFARVSGEGDEAVNGIDYASGGSGILDDTGSVAGQVTSLNQQITNFERVTLPELENRTGCKSTETLPNYMFIVGTGGNDYSLNYFLLGSNQNVSLQLFTANLTSFLSRHLQRLYGLGGRKFVVMSVYPIGCNPVAIARRSAVGRPQRGSGCVQYLNRAARLFNAGLRPLVDELNGRLPGSGFVLVNSYKMVRDIIASPAIRGFNNTDSPCCTVRPVSEGGDGALCIRGGRACEDRKGHVFFDGVHPTEAVNVEIATKAFMSGRQTDVYPYNINRLARV